MGGAAKEKGLVRWAQATTTPARRLGAAALALVNAGLALEAMAFLWLAAPASVGPASQTAAVVLVRAALLASSVAASSANTIRRRRSEFAWYLVTALLAVGIGVVATVWLNGA